MPASVSLENYQIQKRRKRSNPILQQQFRPPAVWRKQTLLLASLGINILALAMPIVILQVYDRIIPNRTIATFTFIALGTIGLVILDTLPKGFRSRILSWEGCAVELHPKLTRLVE